MTPERLTELLAHAERATNGQVQRDLLDLLAALDEARAQHRADLEQFRAFVAEMRAKTGTAEHVIDEAETKIAALLEKWRSFALAADAVIVRGEHRLSDDLAFAGYVAAKAAVGQ